MSMSLQKQVCGLCSLIKVITPIQSNAFKLNIKYKTEFIPKLFMNFQDDKGHVMKKPGLEVIKLFSC